MDEFGDRIAEWIEAISEISDYQSIFVFCLLAIVCAFIVYAIFAYGMSERTYEEAMEEQLKRKKEAVQQAKHEKLRKDKKFKKWNKKKERMDEGVSSDVINTGGSESESALHLEARSSTVDTDIKPSQKKKKKQKSCIGKDSISLPSQNESSLPSSSTSDPKAVLVSGKDIDSANVSTMKSKFDEEKMEAATNECYEASSSPVSDVITSSCIESDVISEAAAATEIKSPNVKKRKNREQTSESSDLNPEKVLTYLQSGEFTEEETYGFLDVLSNKDGIEGWTKKNDPVPGLKKQIQEKEDALELEKQHVTIAKEKLKVLKQDFNHERSRYNATERSLRDKVSHQFQEIQNLHNALQNISLQHADQQHTDQQVAELQSEIQELKTKFRAERAMTTKLQEENSSLKNIRPNPLRCLEVSRLKHEISNMKTEYDKYRLSMAKANNNLDIECFSLHKKLDEAMLKQEADSLKLKEAESAINTYLNRIEGDKVRYDKLEAENKSLRLRFDDATRKLKNSERLQHELKSTNKDMINRIEQLQKDLYELKKERDEMFEAQYTANLEHPLGDQSLNIASDQNNERLITPEEVEQKLEEKNTIIKNLLERLKTRSEADNAVDIIERCRWDVHCLKKENEKLKEDNDILRQDYMEAIDALKETQDKLTFLESLLQEAEPDPLLRSHILDSRGIFRRKFFLLRQELEQMRDFASNSLEESNNCFKEGLAQLQGVFVAQLQEVNAEAQAEIKLWKDKCESEVEKYCAWINRNKELLLSLFPEVHVEENVYEEGWVDQFVRRAKCVQEKIQMSSGDAKVGYDSSISEIDVSNLKEQLDGVLKENLCLKQKLNITISSLQETESTLCSLQSSAEEQDKNWKMKMALNDENIKKMETEIQKLKEQLAEERNPSLPQYIKEHVSPLPGNEEVSAASGDASVVSAASGDTSVVSAASGDASANAPHKAEKRKKGRKKGSWGKK